MASKARRGKIMAANLAGAAALFLMAQECAGAPVILGDMREVTPVRTSWVPSRALALGVDLWAAGARKEALEQFRIAVGFYPTDSVAWHNFGVALFAYGKFAESLDAFQHERFVNPSATSALYGMGRCYLAMERAELAENSFVMALLIEPRQWEYWLALAESLRFQGKAVESAAARRNADRLKPWPRRRPWSAARIRRAVLSLNFPGPDPAYRELGLSRRTQRLQLPPLPRRFGPQ